MQLILIVIFKTLKIQLNILFNNEKVSESAVFCKIFTKSTFWVNTIAKVSWQLLHIFITLSFKLLILAKYKLLF